MGFVLGALAGWLSHRQQQAIAYLTEENRILRRQLQGRRLRLTDDERRRLAVRGYQLGRGALSDLTTIVTPDTILRWHRQLIARKWTCAKGPRPPGVLLEIRRLVVRMAEENPTWGYTRIRGALKNVGHRVGRSTIARILKAHGLSPVPERPTSWQTFLRAHWSAIAAADFFTTEVWTWRGLVTYYSVFGNINRANKNGVFSRHRRCRTRPARHRPGCLRLRFAIVVACAINLSAAAV